VFEFSGFHVAIALVGLAIILAYWLPRFVSGREPAASALLIGLGFVLFGWVPGAPDAVSPLAAPKAWELASELCLIIGLFGVGLRIDRIGDRRRWTATARLLAVGMPLTILGVALAGWAFAGFGLVAALLIGAVLAPTDPVLAGDVQVGPPLEGGEHPVRFTLTTEAGLNDGLAFPFVHLALVLAAAGAATAGLLAEWAVRDVLYRVAAGALSGAAVGWLLGKVLFDLPRANPLAETESGVIAMAGVLVAYGATELLEGYGFIAAFIAGLTLRRSESHHEFHTRLHDFSQSLEHALTALILIALGAALPALLPALTLGGAAVALGLILVLRPLVGWASLAGTALRGRRRLVVAVYGVRGVGSIYYLAYAATHIRLPNAAELWAIVAATILASTVLHGFTASLAVEKATGEPQTGEAAEG
jgi:NhaP-type Na+/H+ or K+/H+ antiporter